MKLEIQDLSFSYTPQESILKEVSLNADAGEVVAILGPNGAGKTTLLKCLLGFRKPERGEILLDGRRISAWKEKEFWKIFAYVPQASAQIFPYTVRETVLMGRSVYLNAFETPHAEDAEAAEEALAYAGIKHLADCSCAEISGGELQLTLIARALAKKPQILVMDEPETGLDYANQLKILQMIRRLSKENGITVLFNTHYPEHAWTVSDKCLFLEKRGTSVFGRTGDLLCEETIRRIFGVNVRMTPFESEGKSFVSMTPLSFAEPEEE